MIIFTTLPSLLQYYKVGYETLCFLNYCGNIVSIVRYLLLGDININNILNLTDVPIYNRVNDLANKADTLSLFLSKMVTILFI